MNAKKCIKSIWSIALGVSLCFGALAGCDPKEGAANSSNGEIIWTDKLEPEQQEVPTVNDGYVVLPEKPTQAPPAADASKAPTVGEATVSNACYTLGEEEGKQVVSYTSAEPLPDYAYVYFPVENYHAEYKYFKMKGTFEGVQRITVLAVYYEQYEQNRPAVTVYNNALVDGENTIIADFSEAFILNSSYNVVIGEKLEEKQIIGFIVMLDSNPKQVVDEFSGKVTLTDIGVVDETDPDLAVLYAPPFISGWDSDLAYTSVDIQTSDSATGSKNAVIDYEFSGAWPYVSANIMNFKSDFSTLKFKMYGENVKNVTIAIAYSLTTTSNSATYAYVSEYGMSVPTAEESFEYDFSSLEEMSNDFVSSIPGSYVKNLRPTAIYFFIDTAELVPGGKGTLHVNDIEFVKTVSDGTPKVTSTWSVSGDGLTKSDVQAGGIGTISYNKTQGWIPVTVNVAGYSAEYKTIEVKVKFYGARNLGIALGYGSSNLVIQNSDGKTATDVTLTHTEQAGQDELGEYVFHVYTIDFSSAKTTAGALLCEQNIAKIMFYIDAVRVDDSGNSTEISAGSSITERKMQFVGIEFKK